jgi:acetyltransferase-like isoleucine patch superfamily enzyme
VKVPSLRTTYLKLRRVVARHTLSGADYAKYIGVKVGIGCRILSKSFGSEPFLISIGNDVTISNNVQFITHDGATWLIRDESGRRYSYAPIKVGNLVFIGAGTILLPGVEIGDNVIVGAGSVVTKSIPPGMVVAGNPAQILGTFYDYAHRHLRDSASHRDMEAISGYLEKVNFAKSSQIRRVMENATYSPPGYAPDIEK